MARPELDLEQIQQLEATIFAARNFVRPTDDLRPRILDLAKESNRWQIHANRLVCGVLYILFLWSVLVSVASGLAVYRGRLAGPFPAEIERAAQHYSAGNHYELQWGMVDAFHEVRSLDGKSFQPAVNIVPSK